MYTQRIYYLDEVSPGSFIGVYQLAFHIYFCMGIVFHNNFVQLMYHVRVAPFVVNDGKEEIQAVSQLGQYQ